MLHDYETAVDTAQPMVCYCRCDFSSYVLASKHLLQINVYLFQRPPVPPHTCKYNYTESLHRYSLSNVVASAAACITPCTFYGGLGIPSMAWMVEISYGLYMTAPRLPHRSGRCRHQWRCRCCGRAVPLQQQRNSRNQRRHENRSQRQRRAPRTRHLCRYQRFKSNSGVSSAPFGLYSVL